MDWKNRFQGKKILVAEDDPINQQLMRDILEPMGIKVDLAKDGEEAIEKGTKETYDLILMDIRMPGKDGYQAILEIRAQGKTLPILILTASIPDAQQPKASGYNDILLKPIDLNEMRNKLTKYLS